MSKSQDLRDQADALMAQAHQAEEAGMKDYARMLAEQSKKLYDEAEDLGHQGE